MHQVQAFTEVGFGPASSPVVIDVEYEVPVPKLLVATDQSLLNVDFDIRFNKTIFTLPDNTVVRDVAILKRENLIFFTNSLNEIVVINGTEERKVGLYNFYKLILQSVKSIYF